jgi:transcription elongation factor GreA
MFGRTVVLEDLDSGETLSYRLVGPYEADIQSGTLSVSSPIGKALISKEVGDEVKVKTPRGLRTLEILEVRP